jgi:thymidylate synthase (FAD)
MAAKTKMPSIPEGAIPVLDHGYVRLIETYGSDSRIIEAARMSTDKGFLGWESDQGLLNYLYRNDHATPFEMAGMIIEVKAPIMVFREWHRHRTQSYNEMSARYIPLPNEHYIPTLDRVMRGSLLLGNKQATKADSAAQLTPKMAKQWLAALRRLFKDSETVYQMGLKVGVPKELSRGATVVFRYSKMRAASNLRNWLAFLTLRDALNAQEEIRVYAQAVDTLITMSFPRTHKLYLERKHMRNPNYWSTKQAA